MKELTVEEKATIIGEGYAILSDIWGPRFTTVTLSVKRGGYTATAWVEKMLIEIRADCWRKMGLCARRLVMVHESLHLVDWKHGSDSLYGNGVPDIASLQMYREIWGEDDEFKRTEERVRGAVSASLRTMRQG